MKTGRFKPETVPVEITKKIKGKKTKMQHENDEHFKVGTSMEELAKLPPAFIPKTGKVTGIPMPSLSLEKLRLTNLCFAL